MSNQAFNNDPAMLAALEKSRQQLEHLGEIVSQIQQPPATLGVFISGYKIERQAEVFALGRRLRVSVGPQVDLSSLRCGDRIRLTEKLVLAGKAPASREGTVAMIVELLGKDRVIVESGAGSEVVLTLAENLRSAELAAGDEVRVDLRAGVAFEKLVRAKVEQMLTPVIPHLSYEQIGGLSTQIAALREAVEIPFLHPDLFQQYGIKPPRGVLLYGPPGCGKTLLAKAVASALHEASYPSGKPYFLSIKGPELLSKFVGETERQIRLIFNRARELAKTGSPVFIFFDEMEALFKTRGSGISSDVETSVVPQFLAEIDGMDSTDNVIVLGASNREDMIDPAVLRAGRFDVRIKVSRPSRVAADSIARIYLPSETPLSPEVSVDNLVDVLLTNIYDSTNVIVTLEFADGSYRQIYPSDLVSGATLAGVIARAKKLALKDALENSGKGLCPEHMLLAVQAEIAEMKSMAISASPQSWAQTLGIRLGEIARLYPGEINQ